jgi:ubiquinone/menaquinone biosynthesis C-methylase UbiE
MTDINYTKRMYDKFGQEYHKKRLAPHNSFWNEFIEFPAMESILKGMVKNKKVLDLGCGSGIFTRKLQIYGAKIIGFDLSKTLIDIARKDYPKIQFYVGDAQKTPFRKNSFEIVSSSLMIHYIKNLNPLFKEVNRILCKNGAFVFSFHHPLNEVMTKIRIEKKITYSIKPYFNNDKYTWSMLDGMNMISYHHTFENISKALSNAGFVIELIIEPQPVKNSKKYDPKSYERTVKYPSFMIIKARKV